MHIETSPLICRANQWTGFYIIGAFVCHESVKDYFEQAVEYVVLQCIRERTLSMLGGGRGGGGWSVLQTFRPKYLNI